MQTLHGRWGLQGGMNTHQNYFQVHQNSKDKTNVN